MLGYMPNIWSLVVFPIAILVSAVTASGLGLFLASFNVKYRDVRHILPFFIQILLFLTPVIYPLSIVSEQNKLIMALNPMSSVIESVRMVFYNELLISPRLILISLIS
ncbi:phosphate ABC transporter permease, partial [Candidatus Gottesmanbacteria bacterium CG11_big_fil_rev_8_21_14_0_20_37_11]